VVHSPLGLKICWCVVHVHLCIGQSMSQSLRRNEDDEGESALSSAGAADPFKDNW